ncbi:unnamed protein product [Scytosiphon promiscuus]
MHEVCPLPQLHMSQSGLKSTRYSTSYGSSYSSPASTPTSKQARERALEGLNDQAPYTVHYHTLSPFRLLAFFLAGEELSAYSRACSRQQRTRAASTCLPPS